MSAQPRRTALTALTLDRFRLFERLAPVTFHQEMTVFTAPNGSGKSALLDAIAVALRYFVDKMQDLPASHGFDKSDVRLVRSQGGGMVAATPTLLTAVALFDGEHEVWHRQLGSVDGKTTYKGAEGLAKRAAALRAQLRKSARPGSAPAELPVIAYYGTGRLWREGRLSRHKKVTAARLDMNTSGYVDALNPASSFSHFVLWFQAVVLEATKEVQSGVAHAMRPTQLLEAVRRATDLVLAPSGWSRLDWDFLGEEVVAQHEVHGRLPVSLLSDGVRNMIGMVADLAHRVVRLNPHHGANAPSQTSGIVLIDEVDMHLHPSWQQEVLISLREAFPLVQFVVTTHSPQVLSTIPRECIRVLRGADGMYEAVQPPLQTQGVPSGDVMNSVMQVAPTPDVPIRRELERYQALIQDGQHTSDDGVALRARLDEHFGRQHPEVLDLDRVIRFRAALSRRSDKGTA